MGNEGWGFTQINQAQGRGRIVKNRFRRSQTPHSLLCYFLPWSGFIVAPPPKSRTQKGNVKFRAEYPRTFGTTAPHKVLYELPHMNSTIFISQFQRTYSI